jgi:hypothetical protein
MNFYLIVIYWAILRLFNIIVLLSNGNWSAPAYGGNYLKTKRTNCIRIMSLNTYNKNVDIIWHYCNISQIKLQSMDISIRHPRFYAIYFIYNHIFQNKYCEVISIRILDYEHCRPSLFMVVKDYFTLYLAIFWTGSTSHEI